VWLLTPTDLVGVIVEEQLIYHDLNCQQDEAEKNRRGQETNIRAHVALLVHGGLPK
jgi:hypothetical protein